MKLAKAVLISIQTLPLIISISLIIVGLKANSTLSIFSILVVVIWTISRIKGRALFSELAWFLSSSLLIFYLAYYVQYFVLELVLAVFLFTLAGTSDLFSALESQTFEEERLKKVVSRFVSLNLLAFSVSGILTLLTFMIPHSYFFAQSSYVLVYGILIMITVVLLTTIKEVK